MVTKGRAGPVNTSLLNISRSSDQETREKKFQLGLLRTRDIFFFLSGKMKLKGRTPPAR